MKAKNNFKIGLRLGAMLMISGIIFFSSFSVRQDGDKWVAPESAKKVKNPVVSDAASIAEGKVLYAQFCKSCHGVKGLGDGTKAATLDKKCGDFSSKAYQAQTDGELYWKTTEGKDPMPTFEKKIPDATDRWKIIIYTRTLAAK